MSQQGRIHNGCGLFVRLGDVIAENPTEGTMQWDHITLESILDINTEATMKPREAIDKVLDELPDMRLYEVLDFARYLRWLEERDRQEREDWQRFGQSSFAKAYGPDEPEYTDADLKPELNP